MLLDDNNLLGTIVEQYNPDMWKRKPISSGESKAHYMSGGRTSESEESLITDESSPLMCSTEVLNLNKSLSVGTKSVNPFLVRRNLGWIGGVFASVALGQLSTNLFQRVGKYIVYICCT